MLTPQEVASHSFAKATLGGYNLAQVDEFLDTLTEDYTALYNENAILKNKLNWPIGWSIATGLSVFFYRRECRKLGNGEKG